MDGRRAELCIWGRVLMKAEMENDESVPCAARAPPVMLCVISFRPGFKPSIFAGVVYQLRRHISRLKYTKARDEAFLPWNIYNT